MTTASDDPFARLEAFYDAVPREQARVEAFGSLVLFVGESSVHPLYARPALGAGETPTAGDIARVRARQRALGQPEAFEWVHETTPALLPIAEAAGLSVLRAPLLVVAPAHLADEPAPAGVALRLLDPDDPGFADDLATYRAVAHVAFSAPGAGAAGPAERDAERARAPAKDAEIARARVRAGRAAYALAERPGAGALAGGAYQQALGIAEIVGVATLPAARRLGLGGAVCALLARRAIDAGHDVVFLSAGSDASARMYERLGFRRIGTACIAEPAPGPA